MKPYNYPNDPLMNFAKEMWDKLDAVDARIAIQDDDALTPEDHDFLEDCNITWGYNYPEEDE